LITFNEIEEDLIPFSRTEFDNSLNQNAFDINLRVLLVVGTSSSAVLTRPTAIATRSAAAALFGADDPVTSLIKSWYDTCDITLHVFTHAANATSEQIKAAVDKVVETDKYFDIVILPSNKRAELLNAATTFGTAMRKDGAVNPLVMSAFQIGGDDAIAFMTDPGFVFPQGQPTSDGTPTRGRRSRTEEAPTVEGSAEANVEPQRTVRAAAAAPAFDAAVIPNLMNLSILAVPPIKTQEGKDAQVSNALLSVAFAAEVAKAGRQNPARPFNGLAFEGVPAFRPEDAYSPEQLKACVKNGLSVCSVNGSGRISLERVVTTRRQNDQGMEDYSLADANSILIDNYLKRTWNNYWWINYISKRALLVDDDAFIPANVDFPVISPRLAKAEALNVYRIWQEKLVVQDEDAFLNSLIMERDNKVLKSSFKAKYIQGLLGLATKIYRTR
jgi:phage tail sheath gpL-like